MKIKENLYYTETHEWVQVDEDEEVAYLGLTDYAQESLGDIVFVELPEVGDQFDVESPVGVIESVKAVSDFYTPVSGEIKAVNEELYDAPKKLNNEPYQSWLVAIDLFTPEEMDDLMPAEEYEEFCAEEE